MKILVVDDELDVELLFNQQFRKEIKSGELQAIYAHSGFEALSLLGRSDVADVEMLLSDINMPGMSGYDLLEQVKKNRPELPVYMVSAYHDDNNIKRAIDTGALGLVPKPVDFKSLREIIFHQQQ